MTRVRDPEDGRRVALRLTPEGARVRDQRTVLDTDRVERLLQRLEDRDGRAVWLAKGGWGDLPTEIVRAEPPDEGSSGVLETFVDGGAFQGAWIYELSPSVPGTRLRITERGEVSNPLFRAMMIFHDNYASMRGFHEALATRLGEEVMVEELREGDGG